MELVNLRSDGVGLEREREGEGVQVISGCTINTKIFYFFPQDSVLSNHCFM